MTPPARVPSATSCSSGRRRGTMRTDTFVGELAGLDGGPARGPAVAPHTPMGRVPVLGVPAKAKPRMAAMASGATRLVMTAERSRSRRRSSLRAMVPISRRAPRRDRPHGQKLPLAGVIALEPVGVVVGGRTRGDRRRLGWRRGGHPARRSRFGPDVGGRAGRVLAPGRGVPVPPGRPRPTCRRGPGIPGATRTGPRWACSPSGPRCGPTASASPPARCAGGRARPPRARPRRRRRLARPRRQALHARVRAGPGRRAPAGVGKRADGGVLLRNLGRPDCVRGDDPPCPCR